jgi:hypothetical protein
MLAAQARQPTQQLGGLMACAANLSTSIWCSTISRASAKAAAVRDLLAQALSKPTKKRR